MKITIFGLTISSSWGNGHATPYRAIISALHRHGADITFFEKDVPYYASRRDFSACDFCELVLYDEWSSIRSRALTCARHSDIVITASYCPAGARINDEVLDLDRPLRVFYDLDTPITLQKLASAPLDYLRREQIPSFDLYLSFTGGAILSRLERQFGAQLARPLYGCVDPDVYCRVPARPEFSCALSYMGTYAADRQPQLEQLFLQPARRAPHLRFLLAGSMYSANAPWPHNVRRYEHVAPAEHPALYSSSQATLNITRREMAQSGYCPSGRFFEAAACGTPIFTDWWPGLDTFFDLRDEIAVVLTSGEVLARLEEAEDDLQRMAKRACARTLDEHTGRHRAQQLLAHCNEAGRRKSQSLEVAP